jgi:hypothetical protein
MRQIVLWDNTNVMLLRNEQRTGDKYTLAAAADCLMSLLLRIPQAIAAAAIYPTHLQTASHAICYQFTRTEFYRYYVISSHRHGASFFLSFSAGQYQAGAQQNHVLPTTALVLMTALFCHPVTCHNLVNVSGFDSQRGLIHSHHAGSGGLSHHSSVGIERLFSSTKLPGNKPDHWSLQSAMRKNVWSCTSRPHACSRRVAQTQLKGSHFYIHTNSVREVLPPDGVMLSVSPVCQE